MAKTSATYVYCVVAATRAPKVTRAAGGLPGSGPLRLLDLGRSLYLVAAHVPLPQYGETAIQRGLQDLEWVSRAAVAHEAVVESFIDAPAVLPLKLLTIFNSDDRAVEHMRADRTRLDALVKRVENHHEWGVRVVLDRARAASAVASRKNAKSQPSGLAYLTRKKAERDASVELVEGAREAVATLYDRLSVMSRTARRRTMSDLPIQGGPLLLDAAFLVRRSRSKTFRSLAAREARAMSKRGYGVTLTGPWPPYTFVEE